MSGIILYAKSPNELIGVMAHETGHIAAGHIIRGESGDAAGDDPDAALHGAGRRPR